VTVAPLEALRCVCGDQPGAKVPCERPPTARPGRQFRARSGLGKLGTGPQQAGCGPAVSRYPGLQLRDAERPTRPVRLGAWAAVAAGRGISDSRCRRHRPSARALRAALAVTRLTLDGVSYGSYVAEQLALAHPAQVSRLVLDSVVPSWNVDPFQLADMRQKAAVLRAACAARGCAFDPADDLANVVRRHHDGCGLLDTMVEMSVGDPSFSAAPAAL
jgi:pimeloyl-ACP methyl ester carboxylesterase